MKTALRSRDDPATEILVDKFSTEQCDANVTSIKEEDVTDPIVKLEHVENGAKEVGFGLKTRRRGACKRHSENLDVIAEIAELENQNVPNEYIRQASRPSGMLLADDCDPATVGFQTPKKRFSMLRVAQMSASKRTTPTKSESTPNPLKSPSKKTPIKAEKSSTSCKTPIRKVMGTSKSTPRTTPTSHRLSSISLTPHRHSNKRDNDNSSVENLDSPSALIKTPNKNMKLRNHQTPHVDRMRTRAMLQRVKFESCPQSDDDESSSLDEDSSDDSSDDSSKEEEDFTGDNFASKQSTETAPLSLNRPAKYEDDSDFKSDAYFLTLSSKSVTSDNTLSRLRTPRLRHEAIPDLLCDIDSAHQDIFLELSGAHLKFVHRWLFLLREGYSVLLHGLGSKRQLLNTIHQKFLSDCNVLVVNGFFPNITIKEILESIIIHILGVKSSSADALENVQLIQSIQKKHRADPLYLLVHNLDGPALRGDRAQTVLSSLASIPNMHLIASIDHINAALMWDQSKLRRYNFVWWDVTSFAPYLEETSFESSLLLHQSSTLTLASLKSVFKSLTQNAKKLFMLLAKNQLECEKSKNFSGIPFSNFYWKCREAYIASSDGALRAQLTEFVDHHLVKYRRGIDGVELLIIPIKASILNEFIENYAEE